MRTPANERSLVSVLRERGDARPESPACVYLGDDGSVREQLTYADLDLAARAIGARLQGLGASGEFVPLLFPPGLGFVRAFFGCLYAGSHPIPLPVPRRQRFRDQLTRICEHVGARIVLSTGSIEAQLAEDPAADGRTPLIWLAGEDTEAELAAAWRAPAERAEAVAYLQYTSGSTSDRKGVAITHANVIANLEGMNRGFRHDAESVTVSWLPHFHDLGLVAGLLDPVYHGHPCVLLSPTGFVKRPASWLEAISRHRGTHSSSPNFGYDHCVRKVTEAQCAGIDLSGWRVALNGAEPVRWNTIEAFGQRFAGCGLRPSALYPAYGLAEATLVVTAGAAGAGPRSRTVSRAALARDAIEPAATPEDASVLVGCGSPLDETRVRIVDPEDLSPGAPGRVGEIWIAGPAVSPGYWGDEAATRETFVDALGDEPGPFLRTGDLGFVDEAGDVYVTGRLKDVIIIHGTNHYPQDIEWTVERCDTAFRPGCGAAFAVDVEGEERLVVAFEVERARLRGLDVPALAAAARAAVAQAHDIHLHDVALLRTGTVPRTSSGKIQRSLCRDRYLAGELNTVEPAAGETAKRAGPPAPPGTTQASLPPPAPPPGDAGSILRWLRGYADAHLDSRLADERRSIAPHVILDLGNHGVLGLQVPEHLGGIGLDERDTMAVLAQLGAIDLTLAMMVIVHNTLGIRPILRYGPTALRDALVPRLATGRELAAFAITEPGAGSNPQAIAATAAPDGSAGWRLHGEKIWSGTAGWASVINVFVRQLGEDGTARGTSGFAVPRGSPGLKVGAEALTMGMRGMVQNAISLDDVAVDPARLLGAAGEGMEVAQDAMMHGRLCIGAACVGGMKRCLQLMLRYAERRPISTGTLIDNPVLLDRATTLAGATAALEALVTRVAAMLDAGQPVPVEAYVACKTAGPEWLWRAADDLVQFLGGRGYIESNVAPRLLRDARVARILEGPTEPLNMFLESRVANASGDFDRLLVETLGAPKLSRRVGEATGSIASTCRAAAREPREQTAATRRAHALCGEVATSAILLAAVEAADEDLPGVDAGRSWARREFDRVVARALDASGDHAASDAAALSRLVAGYAADIGDVEQSTAGEDRELDPLLRRAHRGTDEAAAPPPPPASHDRDPAPGPTSHDRDPSPAPASPRDATPRHDEAALTEFIVGWLAAELRLEREAIDPDGTFLDCGVDSVTSVMLVVSLEELLERTLPPELTADVPVIRTCARALADGSI